MIRMSRLLSSACICNVWLDGLIMNTRSDSSPPPPWRLRLIQFGLSIPILLTIPVLAAGITAMIVSPFRHLTHGGSLWHWLIWASTAPLVYTIWLLLFLALCAADVQSRRWYRGLKKVPRVTTADGFTKFFPIVTLYLRMRFVYSLPLVESFMLVPGLRWLVLWSCSTSAHLGPESCIAGRVVDPDLTDIGANAVIGDGAWIVAHSVTTQADGSLVLVTAPIVIGPRAVIGGSSLVALGSTIGADSFVEPLSSVAAHTQIPPGEVWGGNPAVFRRRRFDSDPLPAAGKPGSSIHEHQDLTQQVCRAVASALRLTPNEVVPTFSSDECPEWDSIGQMAVASTLYSLTGSAIPMEQVFRLRSVRQIVEYLASRTVPQSREPHEAREVLPADSELLPLMNHPHATRLLVVQDSAATQKYRHPPVKVIVAATFSAEPLMSSLILWSKAFGIPVEWESAGFDQVQQALLSPESPFRRNVSGINVVLTRPEDVLHEGHDRSEALLSVMAQFAREFPHLLVVANLPPVVSSGRDIDSEAVRRLRLTWERSLTGMDGIQILDFATIIERIGTLAASSPEGDRIAAAPYSAEVYAELGIAIARQVRCRRVAPKKVLALDADGVLWGNVLGEDGFDGIGLSSQGPQSQFQLFQKSVLRLKNQGVLLAVVSRNELADVQRVFESHPGMILRAEDIAAWRVNWQPKSQNLREIASELNLGLDSFVFVDDDPVNQMEVEASASEVTVLPLPPNPADYGSTLERLWCFDTLHATEADAQRTTMIRQEHDRKQLQQNSASLESYLSSLGLQVVMRLATADDMPRVAQLTQKTNQFNLSLKRRSEAELGHLLPSHSIYVIDVTDRFGHYGLVGVCILTRPANPSMTVEIDTLLISCRALGRGVEDALLYGMLDHARSHGCRTLEAELNSGPRNHPVAEFLQRSSFEQIHPNRFELSTERSVEIPSHIAWTGPSSIVSSNALQTSTNNR